MAAISMVGSSVTCPDTSAATSLEGLFAGATVLPSHDGASVLSRLRAAGVSGGATYDGLIALTAL